HQFLDPANIFNGLGGQFRPGTGIRGRLLPALNGLVDRLDPPLRPLPGRQMVDFLAVQPGAGADLDLVESIQEAGLVQRQPADAAGADGLPYQGRIEPAAAARPARVGAELAAPLADLAADIVVLLGRERPLADPGRVGLADAEHIANSARTEAGAGCSL